MSIEKSNPWLIFLGLAHAPLFVIIAALRWRFLLMQYYKRRLPVKFVLNHYWKGLALSSFTPAFIGLDAYRFIISGRYFGEYTLNTAVILVEKLMALINKNNKPITFYCGGLACLKSYKASNKTI